MRKYVTHYIYVPKLKVKVTNWGKSSKYVSAITQKSAKANLIKLHRKTRHHERYSMHHSQRLKVKSFSPSTLSQTVHSQCFCCGSSVLHVVLSVCMFGAVQFLNVFILTLLCVQFIYFSNGNCVATCLEKSC